MKRESNDIKALGAQLVTYVCQSSGADVSVTSARQLVPMLVNGCKERNTLVRSNSEQALVALLKLRSGDDMLQVRAPDCPCLRNNVALTSRQCARFRRFWTLRIRDCASR